jgi:hypothetical protein
MIDLYSWPALNGHKVQILVEELGIPYRLLPIDITRGRSMKRATGQSTPTRGFRRARSRSDPAATLRKSSTCTWTAAGWRRSKISRFAPPPNYRMPPSAVRPCCSPSPGIASGSFATPCWRSDRVDLLAATLASSQHASV